MAKSAFALFLLLITSICAPYLSSQALPSLPGSPSTDPGNQQKADANKTSTTGANDDHSPATLVGTDPRKTWRLGFARLAVIEGDDSSLLQLSLLDTIRERFSGTRTHVMSKTEIDSVGAALIDTAVAAQNSALSTQLDKRDLARLQGSWTSAQEKAFQKQADDIRANLAGLETIDASSLKLPGQKNIEFVAPTSGETAAGSLFPALVPGKGPNSSVALLRSAKLDCVVWGQLRIVSDYAFVEIFADTSDGSSFALPALAMKVEDAQDRLTEIVDDLAPTILGYTPAKLALKSDIKSSDLALRDASTHTLFPFDESSADKDAAQTVYSWRFLPPGDYVISMRGKDELLTLDSSSNVSLERGVAQREQLSFHLSTQPEGAQIYFRSVPVGLSPMDLLVADLPTSVGIELEGYNSTHVRLDQGVNPADIILQRSLFPLSTSVTNGSEFMHYKRNRFYESLGWAIVSLVAPILLDGGYRNLSAGVSSGSWSADQQRNLIDLGNLCYWGRLATLFVSGGLFAQAFLRLSDYISAADALSGFR